MHVVTPRSTITVPVENGRNVITLDAGQAYVMHDGDVVEFRFNV